MKENENTIHNINDIPDINKRILKLLEDRNISAYRLQKDNTGIKQSQISHLRSGRNKASDELIENLLKYLPDVEEYWLRTGETEAELAARLGGKSLDQNFVMESSSNYSANGRLIEKPFSKTLIKLPIKAQFGLKEAEFPEVFLDQLQKYEIQTEENWFGRYFDIEGQGESMVCNDPEKAIFPGDEIRVREIRWDLYANNRLHINDYPEFAFFHRNKGICIKHVLEHNVAERKVLLHSYNPDKEKYPDEWISLNDCYIVANVVSVTRNRGFNRKLKKLSGR